MVYGMALPSIYGASPPQFFLPPTLTTSYHLLPTQKKRTKEIWLFAVFLFCFYLSVLFSFFFVFWVFFLSLVAALVGAAARLAAGLQRVVRHLLPAGQAAARVRAARALGALLRRACARPPVLLGRRRARAPVVAATAATAATAAEGRRARARELEGRARLGLSPLWLADVRHALARLRALAERAELARVELLAAGLERALFVVALGVHDELGAGGREAPLDALVGVAAAAHDAAVGVARPDIRVLDERDGDGRGRGLCAVGELRGGEREKLRDPGVHGARLGVLHHVRPVARLLGEPELVRPQLGQLGLVAQHLRERAALVVARCAEHLARASPVRDVSLLGRLRANGACGARCALVLTLAEGEREAVRHGCCGSGRVEWREMGAGISHNQSAKWPPLVQIFLFFERKTNIRDARAYAHRRARAPAREALSNFFQR